jgi:hypothetical protein
MSIQTRRHFLATLSSAGAAGLISPLQSFAQEGPPQTTTIRLAKIEGEAAMRAYESSDILQKTILPQLKPFFSGDYTTTRCEVRGQRASDLTFTQA